MTQNNIDSFEPSQESKELFRHALWTYNAHIINEQHMVNNWQEAVALLSVAVEKAGGPFPLAYGWLAYILLNLNQGDLACYYADIALAQEPNQFHAQLTKLKAMYGYGKNLSAEDKSTIVNEAERLAQIYRTSVANNDTETLLFMMKELLEMGDRFFKDGFVSAPNLFREIASIPIEARHLQKASSYYSDSHKVEKLLTIARGKAQLFDKRKEIDKYHSLRNRR